MKKIKNAILKAFKIIPETLALQIFWQPVYILKLSLKE